MPSYNRIYWAAIRHFRNNPITIGEGTCHWSHAPVCQQLIFPFAFYLVLYGLHTLYLQTSSRQLLVSICQMCLGKKRYMQCTYMTRHPYALFALIAPPSSLYISPAPPRHFLMHPSTPKKEAVIMWVELPPPHHGPYKAHSQEVHICYQGTP